MSAKVVITGIGLISSLGDHIREIPQLDDRVYHSVRKVTGFDHQDLSCHCGYEIKDFSARDYLGDRNLRPLDRLAQLAVCATHLALNDSGWSERELEQEDTGLILGTLFGGLETIVQFDRDALIDGPNYVMPMDFANTVINAAAGQTAIWHNLRGRNTTITAGCASALLALAQGFELIRTGQISRVLAGGAEALSHSAQLVFDQAGLLIKAEAEAIPQNGFLLGEGAAFLALEHGHDALARNAKIMGVIEGYSSGFSTSSQVLAETLTRTMLAALAHAQIAAREISLISSMRNGNTLLDEAENQALSACFDKVPPLAAIKFVLGETLGASGAIQAASLLGALEKGFGLVNAMGYDGNCCSLIISRYHG